MIAAVPVATVSVAAGIGYAVSKNTNERANRQRYETLVQAVRQASEQAFVVRYHRMRATMFGDLSSGTPFSHYDETRPITKLTIFCGRIVDGLQVHYGDVFTDKHGVAVSTDSNLMTQAARRNPLLIQRHEIVLDVGEFIVMIFVRADPQGFVQALTFTTNQGNQYGPFGGRGRPFVDKEGVERTIMAPDGCILIGLRGRADSLHINAIGFHWGRVDQGLKGLEEEIEQLSINAQ